MANEQHGADADGDNVGGVITPFKDVKLPQQHYYDSTTTKKIMTDSTSSSKLSVSRRSSSSTTTKQTRSITSSSSGSVSCCSDEDDEECSRSCYDNDSYCSSYDDDSSYYVSDYSRRSSCCSSTASIDDEYDDNEYTKMSKRQLLKLLKIQSKRLEALELENSHLKQSQQELLNVQRDVMEVQIVELANRNDELLLQIEERDMRLSYQQKQYQRQLQQLQHQEQNQHHQQQQQCSCCCECQEVSTAASECTTKNQNYCNKDKEGKTTTASTVVDTIPLKVDNNLQDKVNNEHTSLPLSPKRVIMKERCCRAVENIRSSAHHQERSNGDNNSNNKNVGNYKVESRNITLGKNNNDDVVARALDELRHEIIQLQKDKLQSQKEFKRKLASSWHQTELSKRKVEELENKLLEQIQREKDMAEVIGLLQYKLEQQQQALAPSYSQRQQQQPLQQREQVIGTSPTKNNTISSHPLSTTKLGGGPSSRLLVGRPRLSARHTSTSSSSDTITTLEDSYLNNESTTTSFFENARTTFSSFLS